MFQIMGYFTKQLHAYGVIFLGKKKRIKSKINQPTLEIPSLIKIRTFLVAIGLETV